MTETQVVTLDWYGTLAHHKEGHGRRRAFTDYLASRQLEADPWEPQLLLDVFEFYADRYRPGSADHEKEEFWIDFARVVLRRAGVRGDIDRADAHAASIREIFGPTRFELFPDVEPAIVTLKRRGVRLAVISNWHRGLAHFCDELGIGQHFETVICSADVGFEKPDRRIFDHALDKLGVTPDQVLHVGDLPHDDVAGARGVGIRALLVDRAGTAPAGVEPRVRDLLGIVPFLV